MEKSRPGTKIYLADTEPLKDAIIWDAVYGAVREERRAVTDRLRFDKDKRLSLGAEYLLMRACEDFGVDYGNAAITTGANGKPGFRDIPLYYNLSHSEERVMCIMSDRPVGCDIQKKGQADRRIAEKCFSEKENLALQACTDDEEQKEMICRLWALKESFVKCIGLGLQMPLRSFSVIIGREEISLEQKAEEGRFHLYEDRSDPAYCCAWCIKGYPEEIDWEKERIRII